MATKSQILRKGQTLSNKTRESILTAASALSEEQQDQVFLGVWSVKDLIAHLIGWDVTNLEAVKQVMQGQVPSFYEHRDHDWQTYNAMLVKKYKKRSFEELLASVKDSQEKLLGFLQTVPAEHFNKDFGVRFRGYKVTIQRLLEADVKDVQIHQQQITDFFTKSK
jgi:hypothetical protein